MPPFAYEIAKQVTRVGEALGRRKRQRSVEQAPAHHAAQDTRDAFLLSGDGEASQAEREAAAALQARSQPDPRTKFDRRTFSTAY